MQRRGDGRFVLRASVGLTIVCLVRAVPVIAASAELTWSPVSEALGHKVYVRQEGESYGAGTDVGAKTPDVDGLIHDVVNDLPVGVTNYFVVTAYNGSESPFSNELSLLVTATATPTASAPPSATPTVPPIATATRTATLTATRTATASPARTATTTHTPTPTTTHTVTPTATAPRTYTPTATPTAMPTVTATATASPTRTPVPPTGCDNDGVCESGETCADCPTDCIADSGSACGNGVCEAGNGEDCVSCPQDCRGRQGGKPAQRFCCGDGDGQNPRPCADPSCGSAGSECTDVPRAPSCCGDGVCGGIEDGTNCALDCGPPPACGDGACNGGEDQCSCAPDCGAPPVGEVPGFTCGDDLDNDCDGTVDCHDADCVGNGGCQECDGDGICAAGETCATCADCPGKIHGRPADRFCCGDGRLDPAEGDGRICNGNW